MPRLRHVSLAYNCMADLKVPMQQAEAEHCSPCASTAGSACSSDSRYGCNLVSLDLSHNNVTDLGEVLGGLALLPRLRSLWLRGCPAALSSSYTHAVTAALPGIRYLDGKVWQTGFMAQCIGWQCNQAALLTD